MNVTSQTWPTAWGDGMNLKRHPIFVLLSFICILQLAVACSSPSQPIQVERWVILPTEQVREQGIGAWFIQNGQSAEYWTPSKDNVLKLENGLSSYLRQTNSDRFDQQASPIWERLDEYNRQYIGIILDGKKIVYANYFVTAQIWTGERISFLSWTAEIASFNSSTTRSFMICR